MLPSMLLRLVLLYDGVGGVNGFRRDVLRGLPRERSPSHLLRCAWLLNRDLNCCGCRRGQMMAQDWPAGK